ncbi:anti-sigma factor family protein [Streptomyces sp. NPDC001380]|uniref:anti-sigma factor family protein n=1 Tax=Streptomyces sp. NPDC001380 TaxID=3364566 RepID=UPI0036C38836
MSAERHTGSGRRSRPQHAGKQHAGKDAAAEEQQRPGSLVELTRVGAAPASEQSAGRHHLGDRLDGFVDGELDHEARDRVQAHLATCPDCLAEAEDARAVKQLLAGAGTPGPSALLTARLLAVGADRPDGDGGTLGGSRLDGGSFGRGADPFGGGTPFGGGAAFGTGALGAGTPVPGADPRTVQRGGDLRPLARLRNAVAPPDRRPAGTAAERSARPSPARGRRFAFAAAGAFSVAAVALTGFGGVGAVDAPADEPYGTSVSPVADTGGAFDAGELSPLNAPVRAGYPVSVPAPLPDAAATGAAASPSAGTRLHAGR